MFLYPNPRNFFVYKIHVAEGSLRLSIKMHRIWTEAQLCRLLSRWSWAISFSLNLNFLLKWGWWVLWSRFQESENKGKSLPSENENFKSTHNTKGREMPKAPRLTSCGFSDRVTESRGRLAPVRAGNMEMWTRASHCQGIPGFHTQGKATPWRNDLVPASAAAEPGG